MACDQEFLRDWKELENVDWDRSWPRNEAMSEKGLARQDRDLHTGEPGAAWSCIIFL